MKRILSSFLTGCLVAAAVAAATASSSAISVEETGVGDAVVFLPGLGCRGEVWNAVAKLLPGRHTVLVSIAGFGGVPGKQADFAAVRDGVAQLVREKHWRNAVLVGHSFGGSLALAIAAANPDLFAKVVILDAYPFPAAMVKADLTPDAARGIATALRQALLGLSDEQYQAQQAQSLHMLISGDRDYQTVLAWMMASDRQTVAQAQFEALSSDLRPAIHEIHCPLLVLGSWRGREPMGLSYESVSALLKQQYSAAPRCKIEVSDTARHFLLLDDPEWVARQIASFLEQ
jgi:pimeloyl-ACP methyl ester carboxylesterase